MSTQYKHQVYHAGTCSERMAQAALLRSKLGKAKKQVQILTKDVSSQTANVEGLSDEVYELRQLDEQGVAEIESLKAQLKARDEEIQKLACTNKMRIRRRHFCKQGKS